MLPTTSSPSFSPTRYDPNEESQHVLFVSKTRCDAGPCDSDRFDWSGYEHAYGCSTESTEPTYNPTTNHSFDATTFPTHDSTTTILTDPTEFPTTKRCTASNTLLFNATSTVTVKHSVTSNVYDSRSDNEQIEVLCFDIDA
eukprot:761237_1